MPDPRTEAALEAAAKAMHDMAREKSRPLWENAPQAWKENLRDFVRPMVEAALDAADGYVAASIPKPTDEPYP